MQQAGKTYYYENTCTEVLLAMAMYGVYDIDDIRMLPITQA